MRYFVYFSYCGTHYHGWQRQPNGISVQQVMEEAMSLLMSEQIILTAAGRTDAGVHAELMVAHFDTKTPISNTDTLINRLNSYLPKDIAIRQLKTVRAEAHARFDATERTYQYRCVFRKDPFLRGLTTRIPADLDFAIMNQAAEILLHTSDFASFCKLHTDVKTTICDVRYAAWDTDHNGATFTISADRFLRNMVRAIVGTLLQVGKHQLTISDFEEIISKQHRTAAGQSAPAEGLFLTDIQYPTSIFSDTFSLI